MSSFSPGPWRRGGKAVEKHDGQGNFLAWEEYKEGTDVWDSAGEPVLVISDFFDDNDIDLIAAAPETHETAVAYADTLIEIAAAFTGRKPRCLHCRRWLTVGCAPWCPGLLARRAFGVA